MNKEEFEREINWLCEYYGDFIMSKKMKNVWLELSEKYEVYQFHQALMDHIKFDEQPFFPAFGKITYRLNKIVRTVQ